MSEKSKSIGMTRRDVFRLGVTTGAILLFGPGHAAKALGSILQATNGPTEVDHIMWGVRDLDEGIAYIEEKSGVHAIIGGVHAGRETRNALISLGERTYLEIVSLDPAQPDVQEKRTTQLKNLTKPEIFTWGAGTRDIEAVIKRMQMAGYEGYFISGSRKKPDGSVLKWRYGGVEALNPSRKYHDGGVVPFLIEWSEDSIHPATGSPKGCQLKRIHLEHPEHEKMNGFLEAMGLAARVVQGPKPKITALIEGPKGDFELT